MTEILSQTEMPPKRVDPVCGMTILPKKAVGTQEYRGETYYFCGRSCLEKFKADPARYVAPKPVDPVCAAMEVITLPTAAGTLVTVRVPDVLVAVPEELVALS